MPGPVVWIDPAERMTAVSLMLGIGQRDYDRVLFRDMVHAPVRH